MAEKPLPLPTEGIVSFLFGIYYGAAPSSSAVSSIIR
jgi:hypothetical protein